MKTLKLILLVMAVLVLPTDTHASTFGSVRISFLAGDVQMRTTEAGDLVSAAVNTPLKVEKRAKREAREDNRQMEKLEDDFRAERISRKEYDSRKKRIEDGSILY